MKSKLLILALAWAQYSAAQSETVNSDYWAATDALGRQVGRYDDAQHDKQVIMFYWTWNERRDPKGTEAKNISPL